MRWWTLPNHRGLKFPSTYTSRMPDEVMYPSFNSSTIVHFGAYQTKQLLPSKWLLITQIFALIFICWQYAHSSSYVVNSRQLTVSNSTSGHSWIRSLKSVDPDGNRQIKSAHDKPHKPHKITPSYNYCLFQPSPLPTTKGALNIRLLVLLVPHMCHYQ